MKRPKPHRRLPKGRRHPVIHPTGLSQDLLMHRIKQLQPAGAVTPRELEIDVLAFLVQRYDGRHLGIEVAQLGLSNVAQRLIMMHLRSIA